MLILTRKRGEMVDLSVGTRVIATVKIMELLPGGVVRLGFEAEPEVTISRDNIKERKDGYEAEEERRGGNR